MIVHENPRISQWALGEMRKRMDRDRTGHPPHASELGRCLRASVLSRRTKQDYDTTSLLFFATGYAMQDWFLGEEDESVEYMGVLFSVDRMPKDHILEFKTTRKSYESLPKGPDGKGVRGADKVKFDPVANESWIQRTRWYCAVHGVRKAHILVFFLFQTVFSAWTLEFTEAELEEARLEIMERRDVFNKHLAGGTLPHVAYRLGDGWECTRCPFYEEHCIQDLKKAGAVVVREEA